MKAKLFVIGWFMLVLSACTSTKVPEPVEGPSPELCAIDSLMWHQPDSALACLLPYFDTCCRDALNASPTMNASRENATDSITRRNHCVSTTFDRHYANLLLSELLYKNDSTQTNRTELLQAVVYFDSLSLLADTRGASLQHRLRKDALRASAKNIAFLDARAHYINGVGYYERDSVVEACKEYLKALEIMENHFVNNELVGQNARFMALTYTRLMDVFSYHYLHEQAIYFGRLSLKYFHRYDSPRWNLAYIMNIIGSHYDMMDNSDSALFYYYKGLTTLPDTSNLTYRDICTHIALLSYKTGKSMNFSLNQLRRLLEQAESEKEYLARCLSISDIFHHENMFDSVLFYMSKVYEGRSSLDSKLLAAQRLQEIYLIENDTAKSEEYALFRSSYANPRDLQGELDSKLAELYHAFIQERQEVVHQHKIDSLMKWSGFTTGFLALIGMVFLTFSLISKKRQMYLKIQNETTQYQLEQHSTTIAKLREENKKLNDRFKLMNNTKDWPKIKKEEYVALMNESICLNIRQILKKAETISTFDVKDYAKTALSYKETDALIQAIDKHCPNFSNRLKTLYPKLNIKDLQLCRLYLLNLTVLQAAILLGTDYSSVRKRTNRLKEKLGSNELCLCLKSSLFEND